jgi:hypothetical protein
MVDNDLVEQMKAEMRLMREKSNASTNQNQVKLPLKGSGTEPSIVSKPIEVQSTEVKSGEFKIVEITQLVAVPVPEVKTPEPKKLMQECECCNNLIVSDPIVYKTLKLCQDCFEKEKSLEKKSESELPARIEAYEEINKMNKILQDAQKSTEPIGKREDFFNAEKTEIALIEGTAFERAEKIRERIDSWGQLLFEVQTKRNCGIIELNLLAQKLRVEEREKLKVQHIDYEPREVKVQKPKTERMSKEDRTILTMAQSMYGKKMQIGDGILSELSKSHPEWFKNGLVLEKHQAEVNKIVLDKGGLTLESARDMIKSVISGGRAKLFQGIAEGTINLSGEKK